MTLRETIQLLAEGIKDISTDKKIYKNIDLKTLVKYLKRGFIIKDSGTWSFDDDPKSLIGSRESKPKTSKDVEAIQVEFFADRIKAGVRGAKIKPINPNGDAGAKWLRYREHQLKQDYNIDVEELHKVEDVSEWLKKKFPDKSWEWRDAARSKILSYWDKLYDYKEALKNSKGLEEISTSDFDRFPLDPKFVRFVVTPYAIREARSEYDSYERARNIDGWRQWVNEVKGLILKHKGLFKQDENFDKLLEEL